MSVSRLASGLGFVLVLALVATPSASALTYVYPCPTDASYHVFAHMYASNTSYGQYGQFVTNTPFDANDNQDFTLSHLYMFYSDPDPSLSSNFVEDGWYIGLGKVHNVATPHYYRTFQDSTGYHEGDDTDFPDIGSTRLYELLFRGYNPSLGTYDWSYYYQNLTTARDTVHVRDMQWGRPLAGGEVSSPYYGTTHMSATGVPAQQIEGRDSIWRNWDDFFNANTTRCDMVTTAFAITQNFQRFTATGSN